MWKLVIPEICQKLEALNVRYHADASSSLFVNGFEFEMDDFDVTVEWDSIDRVWDAFKYLNPTDVTGTNPKQFHFELSGHKIDVMSYKSESGIGPQSERQVVVFAGTEIWTKKPSFYLNRMRKDHPIRSAAIQFFIINKARQQ